MHQRQRSYEIEHLPGEKDKEFDGITCGHCGTNYRVEPMRVNGNVMTNREGQVALGARCTCCGKLICVNCVGKGCLPLEKAIELFERRKEYKEALR